MPTSRADGGCGASEPTPWSAVRRMGAGEESVAAPFAAALLPYLPSFKRPESEVPEEEAGTASEG